MSTRATWINGIEDLYSDLSAAAQYLTVAQVSEMTGLSPKTILDLLSRRRITSKTSPLGALSRPEKRIGNKPLYSHEQVAECIKRREVARDRHLGGGWTPLPKISVAEADKQGMVSVVEIAELLGVHEQTVRKWVRWDATFPRAEAVRERSEDTHSGVPFVVRRRAAVLRWHNQRKAEVDAGVKSIAV